MTAYDEQRLAELIKALPPAPHGVGGSGPGAPARTRSARRHRRQGRGRPRVSRRSDREPRGGAPPRGLRARRDPARRAAPPPRELQPTDSRAKKRAASRGGPIQGGPGVLRPHVGTGSSLRQARRLRPSPARSEELRARPLVRRAHGNARDCRSRPHTSHATFASSAGRRWRGWQLKLYGIALNGRSPDPAFVEATRDLAASVLPQPAGGRRPLRRRLRHRARRDVGLHRARLLVAVRERAPPAHLRQPEGGPIAFQPGREPARRLRLGARHRRLRAARLDRGRARRARTGPTSSDTSNGDSTRTSRSS